MAEPSRTVYLVMVVYSVADSLDEARRDRDECPQPAAIVSANVSSAEAFPAQYTNLRLVE